MCVFVCVCVGGWGGHEVNQRVLGLLIVSGGFFFSSCFFSFWI